MNTKAFCKNEVLEIKCNPLQYIYIENTRILPIETKCNEQNQCLDLDDHVMAFMNETCNTKNSCHFNQTSLRLFPSQCIQKSILENVKVCGK